MSELGKPSPLKSLVEGLPPEKVVALDFKLRNLCRYKGEIRLVDYGGKGAADFFRNPHFL